MFVQNCLSENFGSLRYGFYSSYACLLQDEYQFEYTQCDKQKQRWRVSVPKPDTTCTPDGPRVPIKGLECGTCNLMILSFK